MAIPVIGAILGAAGGGGGMMGGMIGKIMGGVMGGGKKKKNGGGGMLGNIAGQAAALGKQADVEGMQLTKAMQTGFSSSAPKDKSGALAGIAQSAPMGQSSYKPITPSPAPAPEANPLGSSEFPGPKKGKWKIRQSNVIR